MPGSGSGGAYGQTEWSHFAVSNGFRFTDGLWASQYYYDDPKLAETLQWLADLSLKKGYAPRFADIKSLGGNAYFAAGRVAMVFDGSWMINWYRDNTTFDVGFGKLPVGPAGRKTMFNGLADSIWIGSQHKEEAWQWVKFLGSPDCQNIVGTQAVVFPAIQSGVDNALRAFGEKGLDVKAFTDEALDPNGTFLFPVTDNASQVGSIMTPATDSILLGQSSAADALKQANTQVNAVFKKAQP
jgi:multiple sugar transport system substrate-binding protein